MTAKPTEEESPVLLIMFSGMGTGPRLRIMRVLLSAHPDGMIVSDIGPSWAFRRPRSGIISRS